MFGIESYVEMRRQQFMDEAQRSRLAYVATISKPEWYTQLRSNLQNVVTLWNARFQKDITRVVEVCCAAVAVPEVECVECGTPA